MQAKEHAFLQTARKMKKRYLLLLLSAATARAQQPVTADYLGEFDGQFAPVMINHQKQLLHYSGAVLMDKTQNIGYFSTVTGVKHDAYGAINNAGKVIAPFKYDEVTLADEKDEYHPENNYCFVIIKLEGKYGAVDTLGRVICQPVYSELAALTPQLIKIKQNGLWGWVDRRTGRVLQSPKYENVSKSYALEGALEVEQNGKTGLSAADGRIIVKPLYTSFRYLGYQNSSILGYTAANGKSGIMDTSGREITPPIYEDLEQGPAPGIIAAAENGKTGIIAADGRVIVPLRYSSATPLGNVMKICLDNKCGLVNAAGKEIVPPLYDNIRGINVKGQEIYGAAVPDAWGRMQLPAAFFVLTKGSRSGLYDDSGKEILPVDYTRINISYYHNVPYIEVQKDSLTGLLDMKGKQVVPIAYDGILSGYSMGYSYMDDELTGDKTRYLAVVRNDRMGLFDAAAGKEVLPPAYNWIQWQNNNILYLTNNDTTSLAAGNGKIIRGGHRYGFFTAVDTDRIVETNYTKDGRTVCVLSNVAGDSLYANPRWEFKDDRFTRVLMPESRKRGHAQYNDGLLKIWGDPRENVFVDREGKEVVFDGFSFVGDFWNGLAVAGKNVSAQKTLYGIISREKQVVFPLSLDDISALDNRLLVSKDTLKGLIQKNGAVLLPLLYQRIDRVYNVPYYKVSQHNKYGITDLNGKTILPAAFDEISYNESARLFTVLQAGKSGIADTTGHLIVPPLYDDLEANRGLDHDVFPVLVKQGRWYFYLDRNGKPLPYRSLKKKGYED